MPLLEVEIVGVPAATTNPPLARRIADTAGAVLGSAPQGTWVRLHYLPPEQYAENGGLTEALPVFVSLTLAQPATGAALAAQLRELAQAIGDACGRGAESVHIRVEPPAAGRIAFGGKLRH